MSIYVNMVGEGMNLLRPVRAEHLGRDFYIIIDEMPTDENWEFVPGQVCPLQEEKPVERQRSWWLTKKRLGPNRGLAMIIKDDLVEEISTPTGPMRTCLFRPAADGRFPGLVLFSEIFQITGPIRRTALFWPAMVMWWLFPRFITNSNPPEPCFLTIRPAPIKAIR